MGRGGYKTKRAMIPIYLGGNKAKRAMIQIYLGGNKARSIIFINYLAFRDTKQGKIMHRAVKILH